MKALTMSIESNVKPCINLTNNGEIHLEKLVNLIKMYKNNTVYTIMYSNCVLLYSAEKPLHYF